VGRTGRMVYLEIPRIFDIRHRGTLLSKILAMPIKEPMAFEDAIRIADAKQSECFTACSFGDEMGQYGWYELHFVDWISNLGYHIEITGEEFESFTLGDQVS
jgi:hypothetical protein